MLNTVMSNLSCILGTLVLKRVQVKAGGPVLLSVLLGFNYISYDKVGSLLSFVTLSLFDRC